MENEVIQVKSYGEQFAEWASNLQSWEKPYFLNIIARDLDISYQAVYKWSVGRTGIRKFYAKEINKILGKEIINIEDDTQS